MMIHYVGSRDNITADTLRRIAEGGHELVCVAEPPNGMYDIPSVGDFELGLTHRREIMEDMSWQAELRCEPVGNKYIPDTINGRRSRRR